MAQGPSLPELQQKAHQTRSPEAYLALAEAFRDLPDSSQKYLDLAGNHFQDPQLRVKKSLLQAAVYNRLKDFKKAHRFLQKAEAGATQPELRSKILAERAIIALKQGQKAEADSLLSVAEGFTHQGDDRIQLLLYRSILHFQNLEFRLALQALNEAEGLLSSQTSWQLRGKLLNNLGTMHLHLGNHELGVCYLEQSLEVKHQFGDRIGESKSLQNLAIIHHRQGDFDQAVHTTRQSIELQRLFGDSLNMAKSLTNLGMYLRKSGKRREALRSMEIALEVYSLIGDEAGAGHVCNSMALLHYDMGQYHQAMRLFFRALTRARELGLRELQYFCHSNLARTLWQHDFQEIARNHAMQAFDLLGETEEPLLQMQQYREMGFLFQHANDLDRAESCFQALQELSEEHQNPDLLATAYHGLAKIKLDRGQAQIALQYAEQANELIPKTINSEVNSLHLQVLTETYLANHKTALADKYARQWVDFTQEHHLGHEISQAYLLAHEAAKKQGKTEDALLFLEKGTALLDSLNGLQKQKTLALIQGLYDHREKQFQIRELSQRLDREQVARERDQLKAGRSILLLLFLTGCLLFLGVLTILFYRKKSLARKAENLQLKLQASQERERLATELRDVQQQALQTRMNPHFTFNCLNSIQALVLENNSESATLYLSRFARMVRQAFEFSKEKYITLEQELEFLALYCELENLRFDQAVEVRFIIAPEIAPELELMPPMLIQPLVENAFQHGFSSRKKGAILRIFVEKEGDFLVWKIRDNGGGIQAPKTHKMGIPRQPSGLSHARERLSLLLAESELDSEQCFELRNVYDTQGKIIGTEAILRIIRSKPFGPSGSSSTSTIHPSDPTIG